MEKLRMQTSDGTQSNIDKIAQLFPECVTEGTDGTKKVIDFDKLRQLLSDDIVEGSEERYQFTWPDKRKAILAANAPIQATLRPCREESVDFDNTQNLYIEGDNLDVLKCLKETYLHKVKMIYIDPPYNTGNDFVYKDDFSQNSEEYLANSGQFDEQGNRLVKNTESNGRFHTDWLNMIYPRLKVARDLLTDDGVIFISIDDNEQKNLRNVCDEIFGEGSFVTTIHCQLSTTQGMKVKAAQEGNIVKNAEYILCYSKDGHKNIASEQPLYDLRPKYDEHYSLYLKQDGSIGQLSELYDYKFPKDCSNKKAFSLNEAFQRSEEFADIVRSHLADIVRSDKVTGFDLGAELRNGYWKEVVRNEKRYLLTLDNNGSIRQLLRLKDSWGKTDGFYGEEGLRKIRGDWWEGFYIDMGNVSKEGNVDFNNGKKPIRLIKQLAKMLTQKDDTILDFFSGSATTAHAIMQLNTEDDGNRRFVLVQLPEIIDPEKETSQSAKQFARNAVKFLDSLHVPHNICEIGKERIRRAGKKIKEESPLTTETLDTGFRVLKLDSTNMLEVYYSPAETEQESLLDMVDNVKDDRTSEDLLFQVMLELGAPLSSKIERTQIEGKVVYNVADNYLVACFDKDVTDKVVTQMAKMQPEYAVLRDTSMANDSTATNFEQIFKTYSPNTITKIL